MYGYLKYSTYVVLILALISIGASAISSEFGGTNKDLSLSTSNDYNLGEYGSLSGSSVLGYSDGLQLSKDFNFDIGEGGSLEEEYTATDPTESYGATTYAYLESGAGSYTGDAYFKKNQVVAYETILVNEGTNAYFGGLAWSSKGDLATVWLNAGEEGSTFSANKYSNKMIAKSDFASATQDIKRGSGTFNIGCIGTIMEEFQPTIGDKSDIINGMQLDAEDDDDFTAVETSASFVNVQDLTYSGKSTYGKGSGSSFQKIKASSADSMDTQGVSANDDVYMASGCSVIAGTGLTVTDSASFKGSDMSSSVDLKFKSSHFTGSGANLLFGSTERGIYCNSHVGILLLEASESEDTLDAFPSSGSTSYSVKYSETKGSTISEKLSLVGPSIYRSTSSWSELGYIIAQSSADGDDLSLKRSLSGSATTTVNENSMALKGSWKAKALRGTGEVASRYIEADNGIENAYSTTSKPGTLSFKESALVTLDIADIV